MIEITFTGDTLEDVGLQARAFSETVLGAQTPEPAKGKGGKDAPEKAPSESDPPTGGEKPLDPKMIKALEEIKEKALDLLRNVYNSGTEGQKAVRAILKDFGVKKAGDVPVESAAALLNAAQAATATAKIKAE